MTNFNTRYNKLVEERTKNGRVGDLGNENVKQYNLFETINDNKCNNKNNLKNIQSDNLLNNVYFSNDNIEIIQNAIRYNIWISTKKKHLISKQSETQLNIIMRSIYLQYSKNMDYKIKEQVESLNKRVINYCVDNIYNNLLQYDNYKKDISTGLQIMEHPKTDTVKGTKTFRLDKFI